ncbi:MULTISPECIES: ABC transporter ATP-binding protein [unclassified Bradyrhizobium]|uniref:ABC transporter ATP-binding protein n=1 Tax=unclassified Bradyrhizobium TaxID=2631580 RepID=UPI0017A634CB|nr:MULTISPECIES: ABC transporter ATP-binding protein [unclassified Bradyrhizobium]MBB4260553.1 branched-chain amino acid transport system ATP-binding protein [Bradyrhizobium sp. CIR3A]NYG46823.1 branched-chain amino acid transport system ATP-binding protein [Bradyrhizobium sp. IAR9]
MSRAERSHAAPNDCVLEAQNLRKEFRGFVAVAGVNLKIRRGSIHALIGPNGAGKTTVFNLLTRFLPLSSGRISFESEDVTALRPDQLAARGLVRSFQISAVFANLSVADNVRLALQRPVLSPLRFWSGDKAETFGEDRIGGLLAQVGLESFARERAGDLSYGRKRALEIATTLAADPKVMLLDEPTQGLGHEDVDRVTELIRRAAQGRTVVMVEHNMKMVAQVADTITVLRRGEIIAEGAYQEIAGNPEVVEAYLGSKHRRGRSRGEAHAS